VFADCNRDPATQVGVLLNALYFPPEGGHICRIQRPDSLYQSVGSLLSQFTRTQQGYSFLALYYHKSCYLSRFYTNI